jgi:hypothetical protein
MEQISKATFAISLALACCLAACQGPLTQAERSARDAALARATKGKELFQEKCRTQAGEHIFRTVNDVQGIVLLKVRPERTDSELADQMWPGAAFARESSGDWYINSFLGYEYAPVDSRTNTPIALTAQNRGYIAIDRRPGGRPGYRYVDVVDKVNDGRTRYTLTERPRATSKVGSVDVVLQRSAVTGPAPRYGVTFEDYVIPEERSLGVASSKVRVLDLETNEVLGELVRYAWSPSGPSPTNPTPWLTAFRCPDHAIGTGEATRKFVDQVLIPSAGG